MKSILSRVLGILILFSLTSAGWGSAQARSVAPSMRSADRAAVKSRPLPVRPTLNVYQERALQSFLAGSAGIIDTLRVGAIQVQFADSLMGGQEGSRRPELHDSTYFANELTHLDQYFDGASRKRSVVSWELFGGLYTLPEAMGYYGEDAVEDVRVVDMMADAIALADDDVDFSRFDVVMLIHAGAGQETDVLDNSRDQIFSVFVDVGDIQAAFPDSTVGGLATGDSLDGEPFLVTNFLVAPEDGQQDGAIIGSLGIWAFITGSRFGLLPLFDNTPAGFPDSRGAGDYCLMSYGLFAGPRDGGGYVPVFPSVFNRLLAGWIDPLVIDGGAELRLHDLNSPVAGDTACIKIPISETEYFLVVNRVHDRDYDSLFTFTDKDTNFFPDNGDDLQDAEFDFYMTWFTNPFVERLDPIKGEIPLLYTHTGSGMYVWHIDESVIRQTFAMGALPNNYVSRKGVDLEEADGVQDLDGLDPFFSFSSHFDAFREGNNDSFTPDTKPASMSNSYARTGISITGVSKFGDYMTFTLDAARDYDEARTRWTARGHYQAPAVIDLDDAGNMEVVCIADSAGVFAFSSDGSEFDDADADPSTIVPYIAVPDAEWRGAPAFGDIDGGGDLEIVATAVDGRLFAWKRDGSEVADGDLNPATTGVLRNGLPHRAPPMLVNVDADPELEIVIVEYQGGLTGMLLVNGDGSPATPGESEFEMSWPAALAGQSQAPMAYGALGSSGADTEGMVIAVTDTVDSKIRVKYAPVKFRGAPTSVGGWTAEFDPVGEVPSGFAPVSAPAVGDVVGDGFDDVVFSTPDGRLIMVLAGGTHSEVTTLRATNPSAPSLGDVDGDGTLEVAVWDDRYMYLFSSNLRPRTNWPKPLIAVSQGDFPPLSFMHRLNTPLIGDPDGRGLIKVLFPTSEGTIQGFDGHGNVAASFPRPIPSGAEATPTIAALTGSGELSLVTLGYTPLLKTVEAVSDTIEDSDQLVLSIQSLPGSSAQDQAFWFEYQGGLSRQGRVTESNPLQKTGRVVDTATFFLYPNPVQGDQLNARVILNQKATVRLEIYNLEGERAVSLSFDANLGNVIATPFDERIDVTGLGAGVYIMRLKIDGAGGSESLTKTFAILR